MKYISLTDSSNNEVLVLVDHIASLEQKYDEYSDTLLTNLNIHGVIYQVKETPNQIFSKIKEESKDVFA